MAEEKKESHGSDGGGWETFSGVFFWLLLALVVLSFLGGVFNSFNFSLPDASSIVSGIFGPFQVFSIFFSLLFFMGIIYCNFLMGTLGAHHDHGDHGHDDDTHHQIATHEPDKRWQNILNNLNSTNEGDWRLAIIEADIILDDMLSRMGYRGEGVAEKLKQVEPSDFKSVQSAWEAHKVRNNIAHSGSSYKLSKAQATRTLDLFKEVFEEFHFI